MDRGAAFREPERKALADIARRSGDEHVHDDTPLKAKRISGLARTAR